MKPDILRVRFGKAKNVSSVDLNRETARNRFCEATFRPRHFPTKVFTHKFCANARPKTTDSNLSECYGLEYLLFKYFKLIQGHNYELKFDKIRYYLFVNYGPKMIHKIDSRLTGNSQTESQQLQPGTQTLFSLAGVSFETMPD
jgi:hypothetical protein